MAIEHNINLIMKGNAEANQRYGGGGDIEVPGLDQMPAEIRAGMAALQKDIAGRVPPLDRLFKSMGIEFSLKSMLKQSQVFTSYVGTIFQLMGALVDVMLAPLLPYLIPVARWIGSKLPGIAEWMKVKVAALAETLTPMFNWIKNTFEGGWEKGWEIVGTKIRGWLEDHNLGWVAGVTDWFTNLFAKEKGWTQVGGAIAAAFGAALVFKLPKLAISLAWKAITKTPTAVAATVSNAARTKAWLGRTRATGLAGASTDELAALEESQLAKNRANLERLRKTGNVKKPNWLQQQSNVLKGKLQAGWEKAAPILKWARRGAVGAIGAEGGTTFLDEFLTDTYNIPGTGLSLGGAATERDKLAASLPQENIGWNIFEGQYHPAGMSNMRKTEGALMGTSPWWGRSGYGAALPGSVLYGTSMYRGAMEKNLAMAQEKQFGVTDAIQDPTGGANFLYGLSKDVNDPFAEALTRGDWWDKSKNLAGWGLDRLGGNIFGEGPNSLTWAQPEQDPRKWMQGITQTQGITDTAFSRGNLEFILTIEQPDGGPPKTEYWEVPLGTGDTWEWQKHFESVEGIKSEFVVSKGP